MDVAGTAVGIASLGIQVCQGLLSYYDAWKAYDSDITSTYNAITDLSKTLTILKTTVSQEVDAERVGRVKTCVKGCEEALLELEKKRQSLQKFSQSDGLRQKIRSGLQRSWYPFRKETLEALKGSVTDIQERLKLALQVLHLDIGTESQRLVHRLLSQTATQNASIAHMAAQNQRILDAQRSDEFRKIVDWLAPPDPGTNHAIARQRHESQTGNWLLKSNQYQSWKSGVLDHLWMYGKAGCGKTILCSTAIEDIRNTCQQDTDTSFAFFYFSFSDERKQSWGDLLRSLVAQLAWREPGLSMLRQAYQNPRQSIPNPDDLEKILLASMMPCSRVYFFVDALDECPEDHGDRQDVLQRLDRMTKNASNLSIFATSRELDRIRKSMDLLAFEPMPMVTRAINSDIQLYLSTQVSADQSLSALSPEMRTLIKSTISAKADGMFRYAYCQLQELKILDSYKPKYIKEVLKTLPPTLDDTYTRILTRIKKMYHQEALTLLRWLAYARSPPTLGELVDAAIIDPMEESFVDTGERGGLRDALNILSGLVTIEGNQVARTKDYSWAGFVNNNTSTASNGQCINTFHSQHLNTDTRVKLAHFSVKEYLESERILGSKADHFHLEHAIGHQHIAQSCLTYLQFYSVSNEKTSTEQDFETFPMLKYAAESWFYHTALQHGIEGGREAPFLEIDSTRYDWLSVHDPDEFWVKPFSKRRTLASGKGLASPLGLYYASLLGLEAAVHRLLSNGADINAQGGRYGNALQAASATANPKLVRQLLDSGVDVNTRGGYYGTALQAASRTSEIEMMQLLLDSGADVNASGGGYYGNALQAASRAGDRDKVQLLLKSGADVTVQGGWCGNALQAASAEGEPEVVKLLLDSGADVNVQGGYYGNALQAASAEVKLKVVQLLLDNGADVNAQGGWYGNALQAASATGHTDIVQLLLGRNADVNVRCGEYASALQAASMEGHAKVVQLLLDNGADVNAQSGGYRNALQAAAFEGNTEIVQRLLDNGADVNAQSGEYGNALQAALKGGHTCTVTLLQSYVA